MIKAKGCSSHRMDLQEYAHVKSSHSLGRIFWVFFFLYKLCTPVPDSRGDHCALVLQDQVVSHSLLYYIDIYVHTCKYVFNSFSQNLSAVSGKSMYREKVGHQIGAVNTSSAATLKLNKHRLFKLT